MADVRTTRDVLARRELLRLGASAAAVVLLPGPARAARCLAPTALDRFIHNRMRAGKVPGLSVAVVRAGRIVWFEGYGWANVHEERPVRRDTPFMLASVSKSVIATAVMQAVEDGLFALDSDVNEILPFHVRLPNHPRRRIRVRHLLTHTSAIRDRWSVWDGLYSKGDSPIPLGVFLRRYLTPDGRYYRLNNFYAFGPGTEYRYSNIGAALAAYLVEAASGTGFDDWCDARIFGPLGMDRTGWHLRDLPREEVAMPYRWSPRRERYIAYGQYGYPDYPDGALRASAQDVAKHLAMFMRDGTLDGVTVLQPSSVQEIRRSQIPGIEYGQGLLWFRFRWHGRTLIGHDGGDQGVASLMFYDPATEVGAIVIGNGNWRKHEGRWPLYQILERLIDEGPSL